VREIRTLRAMWRALETGPRQVLTCISHAISCVTPGGREAVEIWARGREGVDMKALVPPSRGIRTLWGSSAQYF
jgi:hypothetical protein